MSSPVSLKLEPHSPPDTTEQVVWGSDTDTDLYWTSQDLLDADQLTSKADNLTKIIEDLEGLGEIEDIGEDEDGFSSYWMEGKTIPIFPDALPYITKSEEKIPFDSTQTLLKEFETVFDSVNGSTALTPPQSPPYQPPVLTLLQSIPATNYCITKIEQAYPVITITSQETLAPPQTPQPDVEMELAAVDELVRDRANFLVPSSPSSSSSSSNYGDCSSDEWFTENSRDSCKDVRKPRTKRFKPYSLPGGDEKKFRKKEQNKNAATRYRMKKKAEVEVILGEEKGLQDQNTKLEADIGDLEREIKCIKGFMRELFKAKGLIK